MGARPWGDRAAAPRARRLTCDDCLANSSQCAWCQSTHACFMFAAYLARYPHGGCRGWDDRCGPGGRVPGGEGGDQGSGVALTAPRPSPCSVHSEPRCRSCDRFLTCHECLQSHECGWCGNEDNPTLGR